MADTRDATGAAAAGGGEARFTTEATGADALEADLAAKLPMAGWLNLGAAEIPMDC